MARRSAAVYRTCLCGNLIRTTPKDIRKGWGTYCSKACATKHRFEADARTTASNQARTRYANHRSLRHAVSRPADIKARKHEYYKKRYAKDKTVYYLAAYKRRARIKGAQHEHINRHHLFERDNWTCQHCKRKVSDLVKRGHPRKAIMAHINALAAGGTHTWDNVTTLCHTCNTRDGVNKLPLQTSLFTGAPCS